MDYIHPHHLTARQLKRLEELAFLITTTSGDQESPDDAGISETYISACSELSSTARLLLLDRICARFVEDNLPITVFIPFLFAEPDDRVAAIAVHRVAQYWPDGAYATGDFAAHMHRDLEFLTSVGEATRAAAILHSLLVLGDRRLVVRLHGAWRLFGRKGRRLLARRLSRCAQAPVLEWLTSWLAEARSAQEARLVAGVLLRIGQRRRFDAVYELRRSDDGSGTFGVVRTWSYTDFGDRLAIRWRRLQPERAPAQLYAVWCERTV